MVNGGHINISSVLDDRSSVANNSNLNIEFQLMIVVCVCAV